MDNRFMTDNRRRNPAHIQEEKQFDERVVNIDRVARVVKGGRRFRFRALVIIGDHKGKVSIGTAKGADVTTAVTKAVDVAKKNVQHVDIINGTIAHETYAKVSGSKIMLKPARPGSGLIAGGVVRTLLEVAGINNAMSKAHGSSNKINTAYATLEALKAIQHPDKWHRQPSKKVAPKAKTEKPTTKPVKKEAKK